MQRLMSLLKILINFQVSFRLHPDQVVFSRKVSVNLG